MPFAYSERLVRMVMRGIEPGHRGLPPVALVALLAGGCGGAVGQHENSGPDHRPDGADSVELEDGEGSARDIVTYPGGDRVDWKKVELPEDFAGVLEARLLFKPPRDGLGVTFEVYDEGFERVAEGEPSGSRVVETKVRPAFGGTYYVHIFAPERSDAADYMIALRTRDEDVRAEVDEEERRIPDPPALPAIPEEGGTEVAEQKGGDSGGQGSSSNSSGGGGSPSPDPDPKPDEDDEDEDDEDEDEEDSEKSEPLRARVVTYQVAPNGNVILTVNRGKNDGVERGWSAQMLMGSSGRPLRGGSFTITRVTSGEAIGEVKVSVDQIRANRQVKVMPPDYEEDSP